MAAESTSFVQFDYCKLCKTSHKKQKKHIYSKRHQEILQNILKKFAKKVKDARSCLGNPTIEALGWENGAKFWCYFCESELDKHRRESDATVKYGGFVSHIASDEHVKRTGEFFWKNIVDKNRKKDLIMSKVDAERFHNKSETALMLYRQKMNTRIQQMTEKIHRTIQQQQFVKKGAAKAPPWEQMCTKQTQVSQNAAAGHVTSGPSVIGQTSGGRFKTVEAVAVGLTAIVRPKPKASEKEVGNVFTGGTPPWLRENEEEEEGGGDIGPSMSQYEKHLDKERKKKLPADRVGANMDHSMQTSASWLPSFGGVWNKGRRLNAKIQFERRSGMKGVHHSSTASTAARPDEPTAVVPYVRKKKSMSSTTGSGLSLISSSLMDDRPTQMQGQVYPALVSSPMMHSCLVQSTSSLMLPGHSDFSSGQPNVDAGILQTRSQHQQEYSTVQSKSFGHSEASCGQAHANLSRVPQNRGRSESEQTQSPSSHNASVHKATAISNSRNSSAPTTKDNVIDLEADDSNPVERNITSTPTVKDNEVRLVEAETVEASEDSLIPKTKDSSKIDAHKNGSTSLDSNITTDHSFETKPADKSLSKDGVSTSKRPVASNPVDIVPYKRKKKQEVPANRGSSHVTLGERSKPSTVSDTTLLDTSSQGVVSGPTHGQSGHPGNIPQQGNRLTWNQHQPHQNRPQFQRHPAPRQVMGHMTNQTFAQQGLHQNTRGFHGHQIQQGVQHYRQEHWSGTVPPKTGSSLPLHRIHQTHHSIYPPFAQNVPPGPQQFSPFTQNTSNTPQHLPPFPSRPQQFSPFEQNPVPHGYGQGSYEQGMYMPQPATAYQAAQTAYSQAQHTQQTAAQTQTQAQSPATSGGLNLFNSISAAVGSKLGR